MISHEDTKMWDGDRTEALASVVVDLGFHLHKDLGPGLLESAYETLLYEKLRQHGIPVRRQVSIPLKHDGIFVENAFKIDLLIDDLLVVELKSVERLQPIHSKQLLTYLRVMELPLGLLMNFGQALFRDGTKRVANDYYGGRF